MNTTTNLWGKTKNGTEVCIPTLGVCGEFGSGKTLFGLSIAPGVHPEGHPFAGKNRTLVIDAEKSSVTYQSLPFDRLDVPDELMKLHKGNYNTIQMFEWLKSILEKIEVGKYDVIFIDPITDFDSGLTDYVRTNITKFGLTQKQLEKSSALLWGVVKEQWNLLLNQIATKCQTFIFSAHMGQVFVGGVPTPKREPKGKETLMKLASLYLELIRVPDKDGVKPNVPSGRILKGRISEHLLDPATGEIRSTELVPVSIPICTPVQIRKYIKEPFTGKNVVAETPLDEHVMLAFKVDLERNRNEANQGELEILRSRQEIFEMQEKFGRKKEEEKEIIPETESVKSPAKSFGKPSGLIKPTTKTATPPEPPVPTKGVEETPKPDTPTLAPVRLEFPPPERDNDIIKKAVMDGFFTKEEFLAYLEYHKVSKLGDLSDGGFYQLSDKIEYLKVIRVEMEAKGIGYSNVRRFAKQVFNLNSPIEMSLDEFEKLRQFIDQQGTQAEK